MTKLLKYLKQYKAQSILAPLFKMAEAVFELFVPLVVASIIDDGVGAGNKELILQKSLLLAALALIGMIFAVTAQYFAAWAAVGFAASVRSALFDKVMTLPAAESNRIGTNRLITMLSGDVDRVQTGVNMVLRLFMRSPVVVFGAVIMAFVTDPTPKSVGWIFVLTVPLLALAVFAVMIRSISAYKKSRQDAEELTLELRESLTGARVFRSFGEEEHRYRRSAAANDRLTKSSVFAGAVSSLTGPITLVIVNAGVIALLYFGALRVGKTEGGLTTGQLVALYNYMSQILIELVKLANLIVTVTKSFASGDRISALLEPDFEMPVLSDPAEAPGKDDLVFDHVGLRYPGGSEALIDISFDLPAGSSLGIIGGTGAGKSSVGALIGRFYDPTSGRVLLGGKDLRSYGLKELRKKIGMVPQKAELFAGTIRENLLWGSENASDETLWEMLSAAQAEEVVKDKKDGLDERVEQYGKNFSGGQKQRLTIARALVRKPEILVLDDSASALDYATERSLRAALSTLSWRPMLVVISQRASSVMHLDRILVLDEGRAVDLGRHDELMERCAVYREIYASQFGGEEYA